MKEKIKVLCLSFWTPPAVRPQSILIGKMIPEWIKQGLEPVIITYDVCGDWGINAPVYKIPKFKINRYFNKYFLIRNFFATRYYKKLCKIAEDIVKNYKIDIIFSFSNPQASNILGAMMKEKLGAKFVAYFSDPWFDNPYKKYSWLERKNVLKLEKYVIENSDKVVFVTKEAKNLVMEKYPEFWAKKAEVISHCFNLKDYPEVSKTDSDKFIISYIGAFYKQRNPELLFKALQKIINKGPDFARKFKIKLIGAANDYAGYSTESIAKMADLYGLKDNIEIVPPVSYEESLKYMKLSDCLVVIDADMPGSPFLPSKVVDYAGSGRAILGITPTNSPTAQFLESLGCASFNYNQIYELAKYLEGLISGEIKINKEYLEQYDVRNTTAKLIKLFNEALAN
ncbi:MAG: glycosyltransferase [Patescibacteria group bacterium]|nr:glycosyltransferase [Patescibacteria group bacterium]MDD5294600.1 glycosyltransferase [Patescibacteria group bacterium]MDD5554633.1 glycosyltransferase [Patescibacteria group bacterium]